MKQLMSDPHYALGVALIAVGLLSLGLGLALWISQ